MRPDRISPLCCEVRIVGDEKKAIVDALNAPMDEASGKAGERFGHVQSMLVRVLEAVVELPTAIMMTANASTINPNSS